MFDGRMSTAGLVILECRKDAPRLSACASLTVEQRKWFTDYVREHVDGRVPVVDEVRDAADTEDTRLGMDAFMEHAGQQIDVCSFLLIFRPCTTAACDGECAECELGRASADAYGVYEWIDQ